MVVVAGCIEKTRRVFEEYCKEEREEEVWRDGVYKDSRGSDAQENGRL